MNSSGSSRALSSFLMFTFALVLLSAGATARSQDSDDVTALKKEIERLKSENESLKKELALLKAQSGEKKEDIFAQGSIWKGTRRFDVPKPDWGTDTFQLTITERNGTTFKGELFIPRKEGNDETYKVEGKAPVCCAIQDAGWPP